MATPADQKSIDLPNLQRRTAQQARAQSLVPMKYEAGMDPSMGLFDRIGEKAGQELATAAANLPSWSSAVQIQPFASDADVEARRDHPVENALKTYLAPALHVPEGILVGRSLGGGVPGWINAARSTGAPASTGALSAIGKIGTAVPQPSGITASAPTPYAAPAAAIQAGPATQVGQSSSLAFPPTTTGTPRLTPFAPTPDPMQPANRRPVLFPAAGGSQ